MSGEVIELEAGRKHRQELQERKERFRLRRQRMGLSNAPAPTVLNPSDLPKWPAGIDDLEIGE